MVRRVVGLLVGLALVVLGLPAVALAAGDANEASCANEAMSGFSSRLPDCRAYELVSAVDKLGGDVGAYPPAEHLNKHTVQTSPGGGRATFTSSQAFGEAQGSDGLNTFLASRSAGGWSARSISPPKEPTVHNPLQSGLLDPFEAFSSDLSVGVVVQGDPALAPGAPAMAYSLYRRDNASNGYQLLTMGPAAQESGSASPGNMAAFEGASADFSHIVFRAHTANAGEGLYEWAGGQLSEVSVLPDGKTPQEEGLVAFVGNQAKGSIEQTLSAVSSENAVSADGSRVFWTASSSFCGHCDAVGDLYVREDGTSTVLVNASQRTPSLGEGNAFFMGATPDGAKVLFTDSTALTNGADDNGGGLYQFDVETGGLTDLTPDSGGSAEVLGVLGQSTDGSTVYFVARSVLTSAASSEGQVAQPGANNLYVVRNGAIVFIAALSAEDAGEGGPLDEGEEGSLGDWSYAPSARTARVTPDGGHVVFISDASLTGYDNTVASGSSCGVDPYRTSTEIAGNVRVPFLGGPACTEVFLYDAGVNRLACVSCNPSGARPVGDSTVPTWNNRQEIGESPASVYQPRYLSEDGGRVFFNSFDALSPRDTNGQEDVYEWEGGSVYLISSGTNSDESTFADASADGSDVFFLTRSQLVAQDQDENTDLYDARVGGGFPVEPVGVPCAGESCRGSLAPAPVLPGVASAVFAGAGNITASTLPPTPTKPVVKKKPRKKKKRRAKAKGRGAVKGSARAGGSRAGGKANATRKGVR